TMLLEATGTGVPAGVSGCTPDGAAGGGSLATGPGAASAEPPPQPASRPSAISPAETVMAVRRIGDMTAPEESACGQIRIGSELSAPHPGGAVKDVTQRRASGSVAAAPAKR